MTRRCNGLGLPQDLRCIEHGAFDAGSFVIPVVALIADFGHAREANPDTAGHGSFKRYFARHIVCGG